MRSDGSTVTRRIVPADSAGVWWAVPGEVSVPAARRVFLKALAVAPLAPQAAAPVPAPAASALPTPALPTPATGTEAVAEALAEVAQREAGGRLDAAALASVKKQIAHSLESAARLRSALRLRNADEPVTVFDPRLPQPSPAGPGGRRR